MNGFEHKMARHWLPVQGFDENLADHVFGVNVGRFEARSKSEEAEEVRMNIVCLLTFRLVLHVSSRCFNVCYQCHLLLPPILSTSCSFSPIPF